MRSPEFMLRLLYSAPLLFAALVLPGAPDGLVGQGLAFALLAAYARLVALVADVDGLEESLLFAELVPFFAYYEALKGSRSLGPALLATAQAACAGAVLLFVESLARDARRRAVAAAAFIAAAVAAGFALERVSPAPFLGGCALIAAICAYARMRAA